MLNNLFILEIVNNLHPEIKVNKNNIPLIRFCMNIMGNRMKKIILIVVFFLSLFSLSAKEQAIKFKISGGAEQQVLDKNDKPTGETYIGYNNSNTEQKDPYGDITFVCSGKGWEQIVLEAVTLKCPFKDLLNSAMEKIKKGEFKGKLTDKITKGKKQFTRSIQWNSTGLLKSSKIVIMLKDK